jgi:hypothetical protein
MLIHLSDNFMDYSYDSCLFDITKGQFARIQAQMKTYRNVNIP